ncbi:MAG: DUF547 domain-containing protein [Candidatus Eisenbacteria bacterium]|uniref:DUF547 domain-containing protein n=1 Tax=Eiseniibacteriota bacterium TaxID=2212470 RepID=A0A933SDJ0_UNCEI|nr:DUF547 domain-containing protein [Candidatus Eisenbacteria bacterium]
MHTPPASSRPSRAPLRGALFALVIALSLLPSIALAQTHVKPNFTGWQLLLSRYCVALPGAKAPLQDTRFDYEQLYVDENIWTLHRSDRLASIRSQLFATPPSQLSPRDRTAWAINAYNFLVVEHATLHMLVPNRQFLRHKSVNDIVVEGAAFFVVPVVELEGRQWSIEQFARHYVYGDSTPLLEPRARSADPRLSFALCPGYAGGPPLALRAYTGDSLEAQLDLAARRALAQPRFVTADKVTGTVVASEHFGTHRVDFGGNPNDALPFLERFAPADVKSVIRKFKVSAISRFSIEDLQMNQFERPKSAPKPMPAQAGAS